jgi:hypothetical protein
MDSSTIAIVVSLTSLLVSIAVYRRSIHVKALELRIALRTAGNALRANIESLPKLLKDAKQSRERVMAATDGALSGAMQAWNNEWQADWAAFETLKGEIPENTDYAGFWDTELEEKLVAVDAWSIRANALKKKYDASFAKDELMRGKLRDEAATRALASKLGR